MINIPDLLEQMTWAINQGGPAVGGKQEVFEFLYDVGRVILTQPAANAPPRQPSQPYAPDLLPLIQKMAWASAEDSPTTFVYAFLNTISYYFRLTGPVMAPAKFKKPTGPNPYLPPALQSLPMDQLPLMYQVIYWLINDGMTGNSKAWAFLQALSFYFNVPIKTTSAGPFQYPSKG
jgi:hypothetical protein